MRWWLLALVCGVAAEAATQEDVEALYACLHQQDVACAEAIAEREGLARSPHGIERAVAAEVAFHAGDYPEAHRLMSEAVEMGFEDPQDLASLYERTLFATAGWVERDVDGYRIRYRPGVDALLAEPAAETLRLTDARVTPVLGEPPPGHTIVELFPDGRSFIAASSLTKDDVESTGVVALSKWTRLLVSSPRALNRGYPWRSTLSHEYLHLVVAHNTNDKAPVWLQEAIARYLDHDWETGRGAFELDLKEQGYLARALAEDDLVPFEEMHPSLAKIKVYAEDGSIDAVASAQRASLAYAQLSSLMAYAFEQGGEDVLLRALPEVRSGVDPRVALAKAAGSSSFEALLSGWETWARAQDLSEEQLAELPVVLDGGTDAELDPVMARRKDLANFVRLGDLLYDRGRLRAALVEYEKARDEEDPNSPMVANRMATALRELGDGDRALDVLRASVTDYPEIAKTHANLGLLASDAGRAGQAVEHLERALDLAPFDLDVRTALLSLLEQRGDGDATARQQAAITVLRRGGEDEPPPPLHVIYGEYELPRDPAALAAAEQGSDLGRLEGLEAPDARARTLAGEDIDVAALRGQVVVLDFWATWCGPCRMVMPALSDLQEKWADRGLLVLGFSDEPTSTVRRFVQSEERQGREYAQTLAIEDGSARRAWGVSSLPTLAVIDRAGVVREIHVGAGDMTALEALVDELLDEAAP